METTITFRLAKCLWNGYRGEFWESRLLPANTPTSVAANGSAVCGGIGWTSGKVWDRRYRRICPTENGASNTHPTCFAHCLLRRLFWHLLPDKIRPGHRKLGSVRTLTDHSERSRAG